MNNQWVKEIKIFQKHETIKMKTRMPKLAGYSKGSKREVDSDKCKTQIKNKGSSQINKWNFPPHEARKRTS